MKLKRSDLCQSGRPFLTVIYKGRDHMPITSPVFCPLFFTIITPHYVIRHTIMYMINRGYRNVIGHTNTLLISSSSKKVDLFLLNKLTHVPRYQIVKNVAELKSLPSLRL